MYALGPKLEVLLDGLSCLKSVDEIHFAPLGIDEHVNLGISHLPTGRILPSTIWEGVAHVQSSPRFTFTNSEFHHLSVAKVSGHNFVGPLFQPYAHLVSIVNILWMDEILHHLRDPERMIPL